MARVITLLLCTAIIAGVVLSAVAWHLHAKAAPGCTSDPTMDRLHTVLHDRYGLDSTLLNDIQTVSGGYFAMRQHCTAQIAEIHAAISADRLAWRALDFVVTRPADGGRFVVTADLGGPVQLAIPRPSLWRLLTGGHW